MKTDLDLDLLHSKDPKIKYGFAKALLKMGKETPDVLYPYFDQWKDMLGSENQILKWTAMDIMGYISAVDSEDKTDPIVPILIDLLHGGHLTTCNHAIFALSLIAQYKPDLQEEIINELLLVNEDQFASQDCKDIARGKVILSLHEFVENVKDNTIVLKFIEEAKQCERSATRKKAEKLLKKIEKLR